MRRITYISRYGEGLNSEAIEEIGRVSAARNRELGVTGFLLFTEGVFFQVIEGEDDTITELFARIRRDLRHTDVKCLDNKAGEFERQFPDWSMRTIDLTQDTDLLMKPIRVLMNTLSSAHGILEKYTQPSVLRLIDEGVDPVAVAPERADRLVVFSDIMGFSALSSVLSPEDALGLANCFVAACAEALAATNGEMIKLIGDSVMAAFPETAADETMEFSLTLLRRLESIRREATADAPESVLYAGVGIDAGRVVIGNVGTGSKLDYTLLGDTVNRASHLESLTRAQPRRVVLSDAAKSLARREWPFIVLGGFELKEAAGETLAYSLDDPVTLRDEGGLDDRAMIRRYVADHASVA